MVFLLKTHHILYSLATGQDPTQCTSALWQPYNSNTNIFFFANDAIECYGQPAVLSQGCRIQKIIILDATVKWSAGVWRTILTLLPSYFHQPHTQTMWASPSSVQYTQLTMFIISLLVSDQNKVLYGGLRAHNRWMPIMLMKYCCNIVTHAICCDEKRCLHTVWVKMCLCGREAWLMCVYVLFVCVTEK